MATAPRPGVPQLLARATGRVVDPTPLTMAHERMVSVHPVLAPLFGDDPSSAAVVRGQTVSCVGDAAMSCALALVSAPSCAGSWVGVVGLPSIGIGAAAELGLALERTVFIARPTEAPAEAANVFGAIVDGFDLVIVSSSTASSLPPSLVRRLQTRVQSRGAVLLVVGECAAVAPDVRFSAVSRGWSGVGQGHGHLQRRRVSIELDGRRRARVTRCDVWLPGPSGALESVEPLADVVSLRRTG